MNFVVQHRTSGMKDGLFVGDLDEVDFIEHVEKRFGVAFDASDYPAWLTLGDIHGSLMKRLGSIEGPGGKCASQMTFYRLRRAAGSGNRRARPGTPLDTLHLGSPGETLRALARCGFGLPDAHGGWLAALAALILIGSGLALGLAAWSGDASFGRWSVLAMLLSVAIFSGAPTSYPSGVATLGDLARHVAAVNPMKLKAHGAGLRPGDLWESLRIMASEATGITKHDIRAETPFIRRKAEKQTA
jgi:hypothetical protein